MSIRFVIAGTLTVAFALTAAPAREAPAPQATGEQLYTSLGCAACHGAAGQGGRGPKLAGTRLATPRFVGAVRAPADTMPAYGPDMATDAQLRAIHAWLAARR